MKRSCVVAGCVLVAGFTIIVLVIPVSLALFANRYGDEFFDVPGIDDVELPPVGVDVDTLHPSKDVWLLAGSLDRITDIARFPESTGMENTWGVAGLTGAVLVNDNGAIQSRVSYEFSFDTVFGFGHSQRPYVFVDRGDSRLMGEDGKKLWKYGGFFGGEEMAAGDLDGDGDMEFVIGHGGGGGIERLDETGESVWAKKDQNTGNIWRVEIVDIDDDGSDEIVHSNVGGELVIRRGSGRVLRAFKTDLYLGDFTVAPWPDADAEPHLVALRDGIIWVLTLEGKVATQYEALEFDSFGGSSATPFTPSNAAGAFFAVLQDIRHESAILYIFNDEESLVYRETLADSSAALAVLPGVDGESLLVGTTGAVLRYDFDSPTTATTSPPSQPTVDP
jgi:hypothetical protein